MNPEIRINTENKYLKSNKYFKYVIIILIQDIKIIINRIGNEFGFKVDLR